MQVFTPWCSMHNLDPQHLHRSDLLVWHILMSNHESLAQHLLWCAARQPYLTTKGVLASSMMVFSEKTCSCWRVSTICFFFIHFRAYVRFLSWVSCTWSNKVAHYGFVYRCKWMKCILFHANLKKIRQPFLLILCKVLFVRFTCIPNIFILKYCLELC